jgi:outer membrane immunogenic protein
MFGAAVIGVALAADLPSRKSPPPVYVPPAPVFTWSGFYVGVNGGWIGSNNAFTVVGTDRTIPIPAFAPYNDGLVAGTLATANINDRGNRSGFLGGGQVGFNWQVSPAFVLGLEGDFDGVLNGCRNGNNNFSLFNGGNNCGSSRTLTLPDLPPAPPIVTVTGAVAARDQLKYLGMARGRAGFLPLPNLLVYATGGLAFGSVSTNVLVQQQQLVTPLSGCVVCAPYFTSISSSRNRVGFAAGGGVEWMFLPGWSLKGEALYYDLGSFRTTGVLNNVTTATLGPVAAGTAFTTTGITVDSHTRGVVVRAGVNYHLAWGAVAPVVARY